MTTQAVNSYFRTIITNLETGATTFLRLQTALCPIVEALPRSLDTDGHLKTSVQSIRDEYGFAVECTPMGEMRTVTPFRLVGATFQGTTKDTNFWTGVTAGSGTITQGSGQIILATETGAVSGSASYTTNRNARYVAGSANRFRGIVQLGNLGVSGNTRKWGAFDGTDGAYFELSGTSLYAVTLKNGTPTMVHSDNWNQDDTYPTLTDAQSYEIYYSNKSVHFAISDELKHKASFPTTTWAATMALPARISTTNFNDVQSNNTITARALAVARLGAASTESIYKNISSNATNVLKYGAGRLHRIIVNNPTNNAITVYDNTAGSGTIIATIDPDTGSTPFTLEYQCPFFVGLTIVTAGSPNLTIIYE